MSFAHEVAFRAFGILGPVGPPLRWQLSSLSFSPPAAPGQRLPDSAMAAASGAAFATVVLAQTANAFACRSTTRPAWRLAPLTNRLLIGAAIAAVLLFVPPMAGVLGRESPSGLGWAIALASITVLLVVDATHKAIRRSRGMDATV